MRTAACPFTPCRRINFIAQLEIDTGAPRIVELCVAHAPEQSTIVVEPVHFISWLISKQQAYRPVGSTGAFRKSQTLRNIIVIITIIIIFIYHTRTEHKIQKLNSVK